jgi:hypothetical protein
MPFPQIAALPITLDRALCVRQAPETVKVLKILEYKPRFVLRRLAKLHGGLTWKRHLTMPISDCLIDTVVAANIKDKDGHHNIIDVYRCIQRIQQLGLIEP